MSKVTVQHFLNQNVLVSNFHVPWDKKTIVSNFHVLWDKKIIVSNWCIMLKLVFSNSYSPEINFPLLRLPANYLISTHPQDCSCVSSSWPD